MKIEIFVIFVALFLLHVIECLQYTLLIVILVENVRNPRVETCGTMERELTDENAAWSFHKSGFCSYRGPIT